MMCPLHGSGFRPFGLTGTGRLRNVLFCARKIPLTGGAVEQSLRRSNSLLATSPDARLRRIARLAKLPADTPLSTEQIVIYAMLGPWSPYVGQLGAVEAPRPPIRRWNEPMSRVKALVGKYLGQRHRRLRMFKVFGKTPSLPRVLAMHGPATAGMLLLETATPQNACQLENGWEKALVPTTNQVAPKMDFANVLCETMVNKTNSPGRCRDTASRVNTMLTARHNVLSAEDLSHLVLVSKGFLNPSQFERLWRVCAKRVKEQYSLILPRRLVIPLPPLCDPAKQIVHQMVSGLVGRSGPPLHVRRLLSAVATCTPAAVVKIGEIFRGGPKPRSPEWVVQALKRKVQYEPVRWEGWAEPMGYRVIGLEDAARADLKSVILARARSVRCGCKAQMEASPVLRNESGHIICRLDAQWAQMLSERPPTHIHTPSYGMQRSRAWCGTPPILGVVNMVGTRNFTCYMGAL